MHQLGKEIFYDCRSILFCVLCYFSIRLNSDMKKGF